MKTTATLLQLLAVCAAAFSGYIYFTAENRAEALQQDLQRTAQQVALEKAKNAKLVSENAELAESEAKSAQALEEARSLNTVLTARSNQLKREANRYSDELDERFKKEEQLQRTIADQSKELANLKATTVSLDEVDRYQTAIAELEQKILKLESSERSFPGATVQTESAAKPASAQLRGKILTVGPQASFIVIDLGKGEGAEAASVLDVQRGGNTIAQVTITDVKENLSIAHVLPQSMVSEPRSGDTVSTY